ncbi:vomeronasal type-2 receptor 26-like [Pelobates fuscus]|uniref:vomeronasal type-2 receptor 26-like n=1 Tax=Pelobates fuscus TaxID=191477 RepID=UPI002FE4309B
MESGDKVAEVPWPTISYGATDYALSDRRLYSHFFRVVQNDHVYYKIISRIVKQFGWTWVGLFISDDDSGETEQLALVNYLSSNGVCTAFAIKININTPNQPDAIISAKEIIQKSSAQIIIICGPFSYAIIALLNMAEDVLYGKTLILPPSWTDNTYLTDIYVDALNCTLILELYPLTFPLFANFTENINPSIYPNDKILEDLFLSNWHCLSPNASKNTFYETLYGKPLTNCTGKGYGVRSKEFIYRGFSPRVYFAVGVMASALYEMESDLKKQLNTTDVKEYNFKQLHHYIKHFENIFPLNRTLFFDDVGEFPLYYYITNVIRLASKLTFTQRVGLFTEWETEDQQLFITPNLITWRNKKNEVPRSQCSDNCLPGYRKVQRPGSQTCCYDCALCPEGEISSTIDSENCMNCPYNEWPNEKKNQCIPKQEDFLTYNDDVVAVVFSVASILFFLKTFFILVVFNLFKDTAIVRANNTNLSFILLVCLMLSFLCVFLFIGRPMNVTCKMRQTSFAVIFSIAISSVLGKTFMIYFAFKATKPGSTWRKWVSVKMSNSVVMIFSSFQIILNVFWLVLSPPFQDIDIDSYIGKIIIQCNEGSVIAFYSVLGYMGFLAAISFIMAFLARTLPDSFNEAKYITFSMLVFCSVWIAMIPAYLSTKGKNMVAVEIFAILTSTSGLLGCIFFPKCYIILFRPDINTKTNLLGSRNKTISI